MTDRVETAFGREFSEPPNVSVSSSRTHCEACQEPLAPDVVHKCHGNKHYEPPVISSTEITQACPDCRGLNASVLICLWDGAPNTYVVVCKDCRTFLCGEVDSRERAIHGWNLVASSGISSIWSKWKAALPGDDEAKRVAPKVDGIVGHPDLTNYKGVCPAMHVKGEVCSWCGGKGVIG